MDFLRAGKLRFVYLLALAQLVGGPLVLLQVTVFCKLTLREVPQSGVVRAAAKAWSSGDFQAALALGDVSTASGKKSLPPTGDPKLKLEKAKFPVIPWEPQAVIFADVSWRCKVADRVRIWTPAWPQAPPGPPPRIG